MVFSNFPNIEGVLNGSSFSITNLDYEDILDSFGIDDDDENEFDRESEGSSFFPRRLPSRPRPSNPPPRPPPPPPSSNASVNTTILASVLGSVLFICISVIVIVWLVKRERRSKSQSENQQQNNGDKFSRNNWNQASGLYETVGPALPDRPQNFGSYSNKPNNEESESGYIQAQTHNLVYGRKNSIKSTWNTDSSVRSAIVKLPEDEDAYLKPIIPENNSKPSFIDENNYLYLTYAGEPLTEEKDSEKAFDEEKLKTIQTEGNTKTVPGVTNDEIEE